MTDHTLLFPEDILYNIFSRLPIKSLARFRCVCKLWLKYIDDPYLRTIHFNEEALPIMLHEYDIVWKRYIEISFLRGTTTTSLKKDHVLDLFYKFDLYDKSPYYDKKLFASCNGLILVCYQQNASVAGTLTYRFAVINPLSKQRHNLPPISNEINISRHSLGSYGPCDAAGIGFDDSTNTFKTVFSILKYPNRNAGCTMVHSSGTSSWRKITQIPPYPICGGGVFSDGRLYWLVAYTDYDYVDYVRQIVWFDVKTEEFGLPLDPPKGCHPELCDFSSFSQLVDLNGEVGLAYTGETYIKFWILRHEEWVSHCCIDLDLIFQEYPNFIYDVEVSGCWNKDGDILLSDSRGQLLFVYTLKSGDLQQVEARNQAEYIRMYRSSLFAVHTSAYYPS